jgi:transcriptional regulator with XRE-family HTH domain
MFNDKLKELRERRGWTQEELAEELNISLSYVQKLEINNKPPTLKLVQRIAALLETTIDEVLK